MEYFGITSVALQNTRFSIQYLHVFGTGQRSNIHMENKFMLVGEYSPVIHACLAARLVLGTITRHKHGPVKIIRYVKSTLRHVVCDGLTTAQETPNSTPSPI